MKVQVLLLFHGILITFTCVLYVVKYSKHLRISQSAKKGFCGVITFLNSCSEVCNFILRDIFLQYKSDLLGLVPGIALQSSLSLSLSPVSSFWLVG